MVSRSRYYSAAVVVLVGTVALMLTPGRAFNVDTRTAIVHRGPEGTFFGFSVALHRVQGAGWLLVGAPEASTSQPNVTKGGAVYKCSTEIPGACVQIPFDKAGSKFIYLRGRQEQTDEKSHQWFGSTIQSSGEDGVVVACAPRYVYYSINLQRREPVGTCWIARDALTNFEEYSPCRTPAWGFHRQGSCQAGLSAAITKDGKRLYVGAVGSWYWQGQVFSRDLLSRHHLSSNEAPEYDDDSFLGYSSAVGEFNGDDDMDVAVGMPRGSNLTGKVVLFTSSLTNIQNITGDQLGAYFGYAVCVSDINGDGLDDIVIGAPLFTNFTSKEGSYEEGRVYITYQNSEHKFLAMEHLDGEFTRGRFGLSLASLGDINRDGYGDFAVGAPYAGKDSNGLLYIYHGSSSGVMKKPSQIISPEDFPDKGISTLGFSLSGSLDLDSNQYPDLLVGAYDSDRVIYLRSRPVVTISSSLQLSPETISLDDKSCSLQNKTTVPCVSVTMCFNYTGIGIESELDFRYVIKLDAEKKSSRAFFLTDETKRENNKTVRLQKNAVYCTSTYFYLKEGVRDKLAPVVVSVDYHLVDLEPYRYVLKPILNQNVPTNISQQVNIDKNCGKDEICIPDLQLLVTSSVDEFQIGSRKKFEFDVIIHNAGEDAFEAMMYFKMPLDVNYINIEKSKLDFPMRCSGAQPELTGVNELVCDIGNPLPANKTLHFKVLLAPSRVVSSVSELVFFITANSTNAELKETVFNNDIEIVLPVRVDVDITLHGISHPQIITYNASEPVLLPSDKIRESDVGHEIIHVYQFKNKGPSGILEAEVHILWPTYTMDGKNLLYLMDQPDVKGKGQCQEVPYVNPLNLQRTGKSSYNHALSSIQNHKAESEISDKKQVDEEENMILRTKREDGYLKDESIDNFEEELSCGFTICSHITCSVTNVNKDEQVLFTLRSRMWKETYNQLGLPEVQTSSKMVVRVTSLPYGVDPAYLGYKTFAVSTKINLEGIALKPSVIPWWVIILAVCIGLLLLGLLAVLLWKLGFFKRKRPEEESADKEPLRGSERNGYRMARGDAAL